MERVAMDKEQSWQAEKLAVMAIRDRLGSTVDKDIIETVIVMRLLGFNTTGSCGGHPTRVTTGPYVIFQSPEAQKYSNQAREINDTHDPKHKLLRKRANRARATDLQRMLTYLDNFYTGRPITPSWHLIVQTMPMTMNILQCQGAELALVSDAKTKREIVARNRLEMKAFTEYLKNQYFK